MTTVTAFIEAQVAFQPASSNTTFFQNDANGQINSSSNPATGDFYVGWQASYGKSVNVSYYETVSSFLTPSAVVGQTITSVTLTTYYTSNFGGQSSNNPAWSVEGRSFPTWGGSASANSEPSPSTDYCLASSLTSKSLLFNLPVWTGTANASGLPSSFSTPVTWSSTAAAASAAPTTSGSRYKMIFNTSLQSSDAKVPISTSAQNACYFGWSTYNQSQYQPFLTYTYGASSQQSSASAAGAVTVGGSASGQEGAALAAGAATASLASAGTAVSAPLAPA